MQRCGSAVGYLSRHNAALEVAREDREGVACRRSVGRQFRLSRAANLR